MTQTSEPQYKPGDVVNGWRMAADGTWEPATPPPAPGVGVEAAQANGAEHADPAIQGQVAAPPASPYSAVDAYPFANEGDNQRAAKNTPATLSLVFGIIAMVANLLLVPTLIAVVCGVVGLNRAKSRASNGRAKSIWGIVLGLVGVISGVLYLGLMFGGDSPGKVIPAAAEATPAQAEVEDGASADDESPSPSDEPEEVDLTTFVTIDEAGWAQIAKDPDATAGNKVIVFAEVTQFDSATGSDTFRASVGAEQPAAEFELETNAVLYGDEAALTDVTLGDVLKVYAVVDGSVDYETMVGGATTAPMLRVAAIENVGFRDLKADVKVGEMTRDEYGYVSVPVTVTNTSSTRMTYDVSLAAETADGKTQLATTSAFAENLGPGQTATVDADFFDEVPRDAVFTVTAVDRYSY